MGCLQGAFSASWEEFRGCVGDIDSIHPPARRARVRFWGEKQTRGQEFGEGTAVERT